MNGSHLLGAVFWLCSLLPAISMAAPGNALNLDPWSQAAGSGMPTSGFVTNNAMTLEAWVYHDELLDTRSSRYVTVEGDLGVIRHNSGNVGSLQVYFRLDGAVEGISVNNLMQTGRWYHVAGVWDGTYVRLYLNGDLVGTPLNQAGKTLDAPSGGVKVGHSTEYLDGRLDEVRIYNIALTQAQIRERMYRELAGTESGLVAYYQMNESSGSVASDFMGNADLTITNGSWVASTVPFTLDFGDAPVPYFVTIAEGGAAHAVTGPTLGATRDSEDDGLHSANADGDGADEDGVSAWTEVRVGKLDAQVTVNVQNAPTGAKLDAWIDWNGDGNWGGPGEQIADRVAVSEGDNAISFDVPGWSLSGTAFARFRLSQDGDLGMGGFASDGEVEDYPLAVTAPQRGGRTFSERVVSTSADYASSVFAADVDGDGDMDLLSASGNDSKIAWYENDGAESFSERVVSTSADGAWDVFAADVDGDGDMDLLSSSRNDDKIAWYENDGSQTFTERVVSTSADGARGLFAADVDGDGDMDLLSASENDDKIAWYENDGSQAFTERVVSTSADGAYSVFAADLDGDGDMDLASACSHEITWYENDGDENFIPKNVSAKGADKLIAADVDGDGDLDLVAASRTDNQLAWYENVGAATFFERVVATPSMLGYTSVLAADVDGDGDMDLVAVRSGPYKDISLFENDGDENFTERVFSASANGDSGLFAADVDGDGDLDLLSASALDDKIAWYDQVGPGVSTSPVTNITGTSATGGGEVLEDYGDPVTARGVCWNSGGSPTLADTCTVDGSGLGSFISALTGLQPGVFYHVRAYGTSSKGTGYGEELRFGTAMDYGDAPIPYPVSLAEDGAVHVAAGSTLGATRDSEDDGLNSANADGDGADEDGVSAWAGVQVGKLDAQVTVNVQNAPAGAKLDAWIDWNGDGAWGGPGEQIADRVAVAEGDNAISFDVPSWSLSGTAFARFRLSQDGDLGMGGFAPDGEVEDYPLAVTAPQQGSRTFSERVVSISADYATSVFAADVDGDGDMDLLSASSIDNKIAWYENDGAENFSERVVSTSAAGAESVFATDVDGDGDMDLLSASHNDDKIAWYENDGSENFIQRVVSTSANYAYSVFAADVDGDGDMDLLSASYYDNKIAWYENDGSQTFTEQVVSTSASGAKDVFAGDVDGDGDMDLLSASAGKIAWYENDGAENFIQRVVSTSAAGAQSVFAADVDGDGDMDLLSASSSDKKIAWYENNGAENFSERVVSTSADGAWDVFAADVDGDGDMDLLSASRYDNKIAWYENDGAENFSERVVSTSANYPTSVFAADVDGDGDMDLAWASTVDDKIAWYEHINVEISTAPVTNITGTSATGGGEVLDDFGNPVIARGVCWNTSGSPTLADTCTSDGNGLGSFTSSLTGLSPGGTYHVRAYATNSVTQYGEERVFSTPMASPGNILALDGVDDYVSVADANDLDLTANYSLEVWFKADSFSGLRGLISKYQTSGANGYFLRLNGTELEFDGTATSGLGLQAGNWYHAAAVNDNGTRHLYLNGVEQALTGTPITVAVNSNQLRLGSDFSGRYFAGMLDEARVWGVVRSLDEIRDRMHRALNGDEAGLVAYYRFDQSSGTALADQSGNNHTGTLTDMAEEDWVASTVPLADAIADLANLRGVWEGNKTSLASGRLNLANASLSAPDFEVFGHDGAADSWQSTDLPSGLVRRLGRSWQVELSGNVSGDLRFDTFSLGGIGDGSSLRLLVDSDGIFADASVISGTFDTGIFTVSGQVLADGNYYTLALETVGSWIVTPTVGANGSISPDTPQAIGDGNTVVFTIKPDSGFRVATPVGGTCGGTYTGNPGDSLLGISYSTNPVTADCSVDAAFALAPANDPPLTPSTANPVDGSVDVSLTPVLQGSAFSDPNGDNQDASWWQVDADGGFAFPVWDAVGGAGAQETVPSGILGFDTQYYWRVRYRDEPGDWSDWSSPSAFTTQSDVATECHQGSLNLVGPEVFSVDTIIRAEQGITTEGSVQLDPGSGSIQVLFEVGESVNLGPLFQDMSGAGFRVRIAPVDCEP